jgi:hypothetical protein
MKRNTFLSVFGVLGILLTITTGVVLYASGYRLDFTKRTLTETGMILAKSVPDGASVYLDGDLVAATDSTITSLNVGSYTLKIEKEGFASWEKTVEVKEGLVTNITALLPPISPSFTAITQNGAQLISSAPSGTKAAFISADKLYLLPLNSQFLGFLRTRPQEIAEEPTDVDFSEATKLLFSPNENQILVITPSNDLLVTIGQGESQILTNTTKLTKSWGDERLEHKAEVIKDLEVANDLKDIALSAGSSWAPDERKLLYTKTQGQKTEFWVANFSDPLPVGESLDQKIWETENSKLKFFWFADSHHFILLSGKTVSLIDIDGSNKRDLYSGKLAERIALSSTDLAQIIILTSLSPTSGNNLYGISLR